MRSRQSVRSRRSVRLAAFGFLALVAELAGRSLTTRVDRALHVAPLARTGTSYYPFLLAGVKVAAALALAALAARVARTRATANAGRRVLAAVGHGYECRRPRLRLSLSLRLWGLSFAATAAVYLAQTDAEQISVGRWPLLAPLLHTYALPVFAVLAVLVALVWQAVACWLAEYEEYAGELVARARRLLRARRRSTSLRHERTTDDLAPRRRFGLAFECRPPPPLTA